MKITETRFREVGNGNLMATCIVTLDDVFVINGVKICLGRNGRFIGFPSEKWNDGQYHDICYPKTKAAREGFQKVILEHYEKWAKDTGGSKSDEEIPFR